MSYYNPCCDKIPKCKKYDPCDRVFDCRCKKYNPCLESRCKKLCRCECKCRLYKSPCPPKCQRKCCRKYPKIDCSNVSYITNIATASTVFSGGSSIPAGTIIPPGFFTVPANTVTVINGYTFPSTNEGCIILNNGFFTLPCSGKYIITANVCFSAVDSTIPSDVRVVTIYRVDAITGLVTILGTDSRSPIVGSSTCINISTNAELCNYDRIFVAVRQTNEGGVPINTVAGSGRIAITKL